LPRVPLSTRPSPPLEPPLSPYTTLFRSEAAPGGRERRAQHERAGVVLEPPEASAAEVLQLPGAVHRDEAAERLLHHPAADPLRKSEEHTSELQSRFDLVCRLLLEKKNDT